MNSPLNYLGGKSRLADRIVKLIPEDHTCYCEPFCGAAWVLFRKEPSKVEVINDLDGELVNFWRVIQHHLPEFMRHFGWILLSREHFKTEQARDPRILTDVQRAVRYYYLQKMGFGGKTHGLSTTTTLSPPVASREDVTVVVGCVKPLRRHSSPLSPPSVLMGPL